MTSIVDVSRPVIIVRFLERLLNSVAQIFMFALMIIVVCSIISRYFLNISFQGAFELSEFLMVGLVFFGISYAHSIDKHINVTIFVDHLPPIYKCVSDIITSFFGLVIFSFITWQGTKLAIEAWQYHELTSGVIQFPTFPAKLTVPIGCFLMSLRFLLNLFAYLSSFMRKEKPV